MQTERGRKRTVHDMDFSRDWAALGKLQVLNWNLCAICVPLQTPVNLVCIES